MAPKKRVKKVKVETRTSADAVALGRLVVVYVPVGSIKPNEYNPNRQSEHDFELLCRSMEEDGVTQPIIVRRETKEIVDGEHRWRACQALGMTEVPVVFTDMTDEQVRIATLRHNRARGSEDAALAADVLREIAGLGGLDHAKDSLMMDDVEVARLMKDVQAEDLELMNVDVPVGMLGPRGEGAAAGDDGVDQSADIRRAKAKILAEAKAGEERAFASGDGDYRLVLHFHGEEGDVVKQALGSAPADALLRMCREVDAQVK